jgi:Dolichyl-phosphate-mannose-protein mannosyltransferase
MSWAFRSGSGIRCGAEEESGRHSGVGGFKRGRADCLKAAEVLSGRAGLVGVVLAAAGLRVYVLLASGRLGSDEAVPGLMALHIVNARELPVFYWGQAYFGAAESYLIAALFCLFGFQPWLVFVPATLASCTLVPLTWALGEYLGPRPAGLLAALPIAFPPPTLSRMLGNAGGGFSLGFALQFGALLCLLRALNARSSRRRWVGLFSLLTGLAGWVWQPALLALIPLLIVLAVRERWMRGPVPVAGQLMLVTTGLAPALAYNAGLGFPTVLWVAAKFEHQGTLGTDGLSAAASAAGLLITAFAGGEETLGGGNMFQGLVVACALVVQPVAIAALAMRCRDAVWQHRALATGLILFVLVVNTIAAHTGARYLVPAVVIGYALAGSMLALLASRVPLVQPLALGLGGLVFCIANLRMYADIPAAMAAEPLSRIDDTQAAIAALDERGIRRGYADYWTAYPITYLSKERIVVAPQLPLGWGPGVDRYPAYSRQVEAAGELSDVFLLIDRQCAVGDHVSALDQSAATYRADEVARWVLVWHIRAADGTEASAREALRSAVAARATCA